MHFSTTLLLSSVFSFSLALPAGFDPTDLGPLPKPGRLNISYSRTTYSQLSGSLGKSGPISKPFTIKAYSSFEPSVHLKDITASNGKFWVGNATGSYCPPTVADCPVGNVTVLQAIEGGVELVVALPEGQKIGVNEKAEVVFVNSTDPMPVIPGRKKPANFFLSDNPIPAPPKFSALIYSGVGKATEYTACPITPEGPWQVFVTIPEIYDFPVPGGDVTDCIGIDALATDYTGPTPAAYQYARR
ncbi:MAG: hypothetical protein LQ341_006716 [Variospora aurantia]|nr:MAG: hypothetical protein LQ341_006716 [Variospora aurantia]